VQVRVETWGVLAIFTLAGCQHTATVETGTSSFKVVESPAAPPPKSGGKVSVEPTNRAQYRDAIVYEKSIVLPVYPEKALAARAGGAQVGVHLVIDTQGRVSDVRPSMVAVTIAPAEFTAAFQLAVEAAVRQWLFKPARVEYVETITGKNGFTYARVDRTETVEAEVDLSFTFSATGKVQTGAGKH